LPEEAAGGLMSEKTLLIDFENVPKVDLAAVPAGVRVLFFFGASQHKVTLEFMRSARKLGERFVDIDIEDQGKNALDFHIAFYLGEHLAKAPAGEYIILSKDKGFEPLVKHLKGRGFKVRRASSLAEAFATAKPAAAQPVDVDQVITFLKGVEKSKRPRRRTGLVAHIKSHFKKQQLSAEDAERLVIRMLAEKRIAESDGKVAYNF
jgi:hypothetical protein